MIYLDNSATTRLSDAAVREMTAAIKCFANPSSLHEGGIKAREFIDTARSRIMSASGLRPADGWHIIFTGSGSEGTNLAIAGAAKAKKHFSSKRIIISDSEHPSVTNTAESLSYLGFETVKIPTKGGRIDTDVLENELQKGAFLVSVMLVNNETGAVYDIKKVSELTRRYAPDALIHCDAVQGFIRVPLPVRYVDMITVSAHKIHGPKGVGALLVSPSVIKKRSLTPVIYGGGQEEGLRSGTENVPGIAAFGAAAAEGAKNAEHDGEKLEKLYLYCREALENTGCRVNMPENRVNHILSVTLPHIKSQTMLSFLSSRGIYVSSGSACSSHSGHISGVLTAYGLTSADADSTLRISFCADNTEEEISALADAVGEGISRLVKIK